MDSNVWIIKLLAIIINRQLTIWFLGWKREHYTWSMHYTTK